MINVSISFLPEADTEIPLPRYETDGAAGMDLRVNFAKDIRAAGTVLKSGQHMLLPTGLRMAIPVGYEGQVRPRSGLAYKNGVTVLNSPGTIDSDYRGPLGVILINHGAEDFKVNHGDRIAQIVFAPITQLAFEPVETLDETHRGSGGFGSTGRG